MRKFSGKMGEAKILKRGPFLVKRDERLFFCRGKEDDGSAKGVLHWERTKGFSGFGFWRRGIFGLCTWFDFEEKEKMGRNRK